MPAVDKRAAREAFNRADQLENELATRYPDAWRQLDHFRTQPLAPWPDWCLLPMAAAVAVTTGGIPAHLVPALPPGPNAAMSAIYAWRFSRSVYVVEPALLQRLFATVPDDLDLGAFTTLPEWCVFIAGSHPEWPGAGLWAHLEHDINTGRPELRLIIDLGDDGIDTLIPIPVYLDRPTITEALGDFRATAERTITQQRAGLDIRGGDLDAAVAALADRVDGLLAVVAYLARPEADIVNADRPGVRPVRARRPVRDRTVWAVGYS